ncbi:MAG: hypothetical protein IPM23_10965 [Candidatus Melainabacteria bacterium]|nr:hypothetical protein [Candidatus Melainabacteria bacterium]
MPSPCTIKELNWYDFPSLMLENGLVRMVVVPTLGAKIVSLCKISGKGSAREWLFKSPRQEPRLPDFDQKYTEEDNLGLWDECFPSVSPTHYPNGPWRGSAVPDHGELWCQPWKEKKKCNDEELEVRTVTYGVRFPYRFERVIRMRRGSPTIELVYNCHNLSIFPFNFIWCPQPAFEARPGMQIILPAQEMTVYSSARDEFGQLGTRQLWPSVQTNDDHYYDLSVFPSRDADIALKMYGRSPTQGFVALKDPSTDSEMAMEFDYNEITHIALTLNFGAWPGKPGQPNHYYAMIAPCIGLLDDLVLAVNHYEEYGQIAPKDLRTWRLRITLS